MIAGDGITRRVAASGGTSLEPLDAAMEAIMAAVVIGYRYLHSRASVPRSHQAQLSKADLAFDP